MQLLLFQFKKVKSTKMVLPTTELRSTLNPFSVLTPEEDEGMLTVGDATENGKFDGNNNSKLKCNTISVPSAARRNRQAVMQMQQGGNGVGGSSTLNRVVSRVKSLSPPPPVLPIEQVLYHQRNNHHNHNHQQSSVCTEEQGCDNAASDHQRQHQVKPNQVSGTTTLTEQHENEKEIEKRLANELSNQQNNYNYQQQVTPQLYDGSSNKILNLLNAKNTNFLSNASSSKSSKLSEDELFSDLKSRFLEKHFRTILRSQQSKESRIFGGSGNGGGNGNVVGILKSSGKNGATKDFACKDTPSSGISVGCSTLLKSLRFVTVERPEPTLDTPRQTYFKSTKQKFMKMHDQAKIRLAERYRKLCASFSTSVWPRLYPFRVVVELLLSNVFMMLVAPFAMCAVLLLCLVRMAVGAVLRIRFDLTFN